MKKTAVLWILALLFVLGGKVQAADSRVDAILDEAEKAMKEVKVIGAGSVIDGSLLSELEVDMNTGVIYMGLMEDNSIWMDKQSNISYMYSDGKYYFMPLENGELDSTNIDFSADIDRTLAFTYVGEVTYKVKDTSVNCYELSAIQKEQGYTTVYTYYISTETYRLAAIEIAMEGISSTTYYYYPEAVTVPQEIKDKATLMEGYSFTKNKITYEVGYVKGNPVLYVTKARKVKGKVKLPDTVSILGKQYKVYGIEAAAFKNNKNITSVTIGKYVRAIGKQAFYNCKKLKNVTIKSTKITKIGTKAFYGNAKTLKLKVPKKKASKYNRLIQKSKVSSKLVISKF